MTTSSRSRCRGSGGDRGSVSVEVVLYAPLLFLLVLLGVHLAVWALAQLGVQHAAHHGLQTARVAGGTAAAGRADAAAVLAQVAGGVVDDPRIVATRTADTASVTITAAVRPVLPLLHLHVSTTVSAPTERFRPDLLAGPAPIRPGTTLPGTGGRTT